MPTIQRIGLLIALVSSVALAGCTDTGKPDDPLTDEQKIEHWKLADWLHDIDSANAVWKRGRNGDFGPSTMGVVPRLELVGRAVALSSSVDIGVRECWFDREVDTAHTDHACLDKEGYKRD